MTADLAEIRKDSLPMLCYPTGIFTITMASVKSCSYRINQPTEEADDTAYDLWSAFRECAFGEQTKLFVGWPKSFEDAPKSCSPVMDGFQHFPVFEEFKGVSYALCCNLLFRKPISEQLYTVASILISARSAAETFEYIEFSEINGLRKFESELAGHVPLHVVEN